MKIPQIILLAYKEQKNRKKNINEIHEKTAETHTVNRIDRRTDRQSKRQAVIQIIIQTDLQRLHTFLSTHPFSFLFF